MTNGSGCGCRRIGSRGALVVGGVATATGSSRSTALDMIVNGRANPIGVAEAIGTEEIIVRGA